MLFMNGRIYVCKYFTFHRLTTCRNGYLEEGYAEENYEEYIELVYFYDKAGALQEEQKGLLSLTSKNDDETAVTKEAVVDYIHELIAKEVKFHHQRINFARDLVCEKLGIKLSEADVSKLVARGTSLRLYTDLAITKLFRDLSEIINVKLLSALYAHKQPHSVVLILDILKKNKINSCDMQNKILAMKPEQVFNLCTALSIFEENEAPVSQEMINRLFDKKDLRQYIKIYRVVEKIGLFYEQKEEQKEDFIDKVCECYDPHSYLEIVEKLWQEKLLTTALAEGLLSCKYPSIVGDFLLNYQKKAVFPLSALEQDIIIQWCAEQPNNAEYLFGGLRILLKNNIPFSTFIYELMVSHTKDNKFCNSNLVCKIISTLYKWQLSENIISHIFTDPSLDTGRIFFLMHEQDPSVVPEQELINHVCNYLSTKNTIYTIGFATIVLILAKNNVTVNYEQFELIANQALEKSKGKAEVNPQEVLKIANTCIQSPNISLKELVQQQPNLLQFKPEPKSSENNDQGRWWCNLI